VDQGLYGQEELSLVPEVTLNLSRGCGNPTGFADLKPGEVVVDFGCGGGIDVILAAHKVGSQGKVVGIDFADQMIERAKQTVTEAGLQERKIELYVSDMEKTQLPDSFADIVISNCVINLCPDKNAVYQEAFRILRPNGRLAISDIVLTGNIDSELQERFQSTWAGCLGGAIAEEDYMDTVRQAGFTEIKIVVRHTLTVEELEAMACCPGKEFTPAPAKEDLGVVQGKVMSVKFTAIKSSLS
jgi:arsenite methyltransferase